MKQELPGFNNTRTVNFQMFKLDLEKTEEPEIKLPTSARSSKKQESSRKTSTSALLTTSKFLTVWITTNWKILQETGIPDHRTCLLRNLYAGQEATVRTGHGTTDWLQIRKGVHQGCILSPCLFNFCAEYIMRNAGLDEAQARIKIAGRNINNLRYADNTTLMAEIKEELESLDASGRGEWKSWLKAQHIQKTKIMAPGSVISWQIDGETVRDFIFWESKITADGDCSHEIKNRLLLGRKAMTNLDSILKSRDIALPTKVHLVKAMVFPVVMYGCESGLWGKLSAKNWCFWTAVLEKTLKSPLDSKEIKLVHPQGNQSWTFIGRTHAETETSKLWPSDAKNWLIWKDSDAAKDWRWEEKVMTEDEMAGWHHRIDGHQFEEAPGVDERHGGLVCCSPWGRKESDSTEQLNCMNKIRMCAGSISFKSCLKWSPNFDELPWLLSSCLRWFLGFSSLVSASPPFLNQQLFEFALETQGRSWRQESVPYKQEMEDRKASMPRTPQGPAQFILSLYGKMKDPE